MFLDIYILQGSVM